MDRLSLLCNNLNDYILEHPSVQSDNELRKVVEEALDKLYQSYQLAGQRCFNDASGIITKRDGEILFESIQNSTVLNDTLSEDSKEFKEIQKQLLIEMMRADEELGLYDEDLKAAYLAGFKTSAEGYNGEYPFQWESDKRIWEGIGEDFEKWLNEYKKN